MFPHDWEAWERAEDSNLGRSAPKARTGEREGSSPQPHPGASRKGQDRMTRRIMGIDLGTTNTCVAVLEGGRPVVIPNSEGSRTTPSVVAFDKEGGVLVGSSARRQSVTNPQRTFHSVKRLIGRRFESPEVQALVSQLAFELSANERGEVVVSGTARDLTPVEISARLLKAARGFAEEYYGDECKDAVITCPAYFNDAQRSATQDAGRIAGLNVLRIINEPTAAALAYGFEKGKTGTVVVYDWGGGTFDCSVLECADGVVQVRTTRGESTLGGNDIDQKLVVMMRDNYYRVHGQELDQDPVALQRLREAAETAKIELSSTSESEIILPFLAADETGPKHLQMTISRQRFESLIADFVDTTVERCRQALDDAGLTPAEVDDVLLVGGSTKIPLVQRRLEEFFGQAPRKGVHADEAVALGAALQGGIIAGEMDDILLLDVLPLSLGIAEGERFAPILRRNTSLPTFRSDTFSTVRDFQSSVLFRVYQGDHPSARDNSLIGSFRLDRLPPRRKGQVRIEVKFSVDENGILEVAAIDERTKLAASIQVRDSLRLSDDEIARLSASLDDEF